MLSMFLNVQKKNLQTYEVLKLEEEDLICTWCDKELYDHKTLNRHNELYSLDSLTCGECLRFMNMSAAM